MRDFSYTIRHKTIPSLLIFSFRWPPALGRPPELLLKKTGNVWSVRIGNGYRAIALLQDDVLYWFWIGTHDEYERLLAIH